MLKVGWDSADSASECPDEHFCTLTRYSALSKVWEAGEVIKANGRTKIMIITTSIIIIIVSAV